jgi:hypothetical protein
MWDEPGWEIHADVEVCEFHDVERHLGVLAESSRPCHHCVSTIADKGSQKILTWICPRVVIATNEGGYNTTGVCLDCILEAACDLENARLGGGKEVYVNRLLYAKIRGKNKE